MGRLSRLAPPISLQPGCHSGGGKVPDGNHGGLKTTGLFNWLEWFDRKASKLPSAPSWLGPYGPFMLARYPHLRPQPIPDNPHSRIMCESGEMTAARLFAEWESRIAANQEAGVCLDGLDEEPRKQLAALMIDIVSDLEMRAATDRSSQWKRQLRKEASTRIRMLNRKLAYAQQAVQKLINYAEVSDNETSFDSPIYKARRLLGQPYMVAASNALRDLDIKHLPDAQHHIEIACESLSDGHEDVEVFGMVRLYWFFRHGCDLPGNEAEVRVARLRNAFWSSYGVKNITYRAKYDGIDSQGCEGVHITVSRHKPRRGTS